MYRKIERSDLRVKREQITMIAEILRAESQGLLTFYIADQVAEIVEKDKEISDKVLDAAKQKLKK